jgi:hypothetical protein
MARNESTLNATYLQLDVAFAFDDTRSSVSVFMGEDLVAEGTARRRKGDVRNDDAGLSLALGRALVQLGEGELAIAEELLEDAE